LSAFAQINYRDPVNVIYEGVEFSLTVPQEPPRNNPVVRRLPASVPKLTRHLILGGAALQRCDKRHR
jgi:hypothetical protein